MDAAELLKRLRETFRLELQEHSSTLGQGLLALEAGQVADERLETFRSLYRAAHSLKGAARAVDYPEIAELAHAMEEVLKGLGAGSLSPSPDLYGLLFRCVDRLEDAARRAAPGAPLGPLGAAAHVRALERAAKGGAFEVPAGAPEAPPPPEARPAEGSRAPVELARLDALLTRSAELLVERGRLRGRAVQVAELSERLAAWQRSSATLQKAQSVLRRLDASEPGVLEAITGLEHTRRTLRTLAHDLEVEATGLTREIDRLDRVAEPLEQDIRHVRMLPFGDLGPRLERAVRDASAHEGKQARLELVGEGVEADRAVLEQLRDPLVHLVRNAVVHGIERPAERLAAGKPSCGTVTVRAAVRGPNVEVEVSDDGAGVDLEALRDAAARLGLAAPSNDRDLLRLVFVSELSTRRTADEVAGRGIGLDVVLASVEALHGGVEIHSAAGEGTRITTLVPLTLTRLRALTMRAGGEVLCIASSNVVRLLRVGRDELRRVEGRDMLGYEGELVPLVDLAESLGLPPDPRAHSQRKLSVALVVGGERRAALVVDELLAEREVVVRNLGRRLLRVRGVAGAVVTTSGRVGLLLSVGEIARGARRRRTSAERVRRRLEAPTERRAARLLVADDSATTRALVASVLQGEGYRVETVTDGAEALARLRDSAFDLLVADVEMPHMTGFELTRAVRADPQLAELPVVLVTGLGGPADRARGLEAGANAYLVKSSFDQLELLETIGQLV